MSDKTEPPTPKRLRDARMKGQVAKSKEVSSAAVIVTTMFILLGLSDFYLEKFTELLTMPLFIEGVSFEKGFDTIVREVFELGLLLILPFVCVAMLAGIIGNFIQVGFLIAPEAIKPDLKRLNPLSALKNIFSKRNLIELLKSVVKIVFMAYLIAHIIWLNIPTLFSLPHCGLDCMMPMLGFLFSKVVIYASIAFVIVAAADYALQRFEYIKGLKMSKDEVKREYKEMEGDPEIKGRRRQLFQEIINSQQVANVKRSSAIISNPTHVAIGLYYDQERTPLPIVTIKEQGLLALRIINIAEQEGVPVLQNVPLAHSLLDQADLNAYIPDTLVAPVAEVLSAIREL